MSTGKKPGTFEKGAGRDPRINRKGRPPSFDAARELARSISHEVATGKGKDGEPGAPIVIDGHVATVVEMILRQWAASRDARLQQAFMAYAYGKPPDRAEVSGPNGQPIETKDVSDVISKLLPESATE